MCPLRSTYVRTCVQASFTVYFSTVFVCVQLMSLMRINCSETSLDLAILDQDLVGYSIPTYICCTYVRMFSCGEWWHVC